MRTLLVLLLTSPLLSSQVMVNTFAGGRIRSGAGAQDVALAEVNGLTWDASGNLIFCERSTNLIRRIRPDGMIETIAGNGVTGFSGDGGPALNASLNWPGYPRFDAKGNLYFADFYNYRIRRIDTRGVITTVAGDGVFLKAGMDLERPALSRSIDSITDLAVDTDGNVYFTETNGPFVRRATTGGRIEIFAGIAHPDCPLCSDGDGGPARSARLAFPMILAFDGAGNLYMVEGFSGSKIRRIAPDGAITRFAGYASPSAPSADDEGKAALDSYLYRLSGMAADPAGNVYIVHDPGLVPRGLGTRIRRIDSSGTLKTIAGGQIASSPDGPALPSGISPYGLTVDSAGNIAFAESTNAGFARVVREVTAQSTLKTLAGGSPKPAPDGTPVRDAWFVRPVAIAFNRAGDLYIAESDACLIRKIGADGMLATAAGTGKCGDAASLRPSATQDLAPPASLALDSRNRLYVADIFGNVYVISPDGKVTPAMFPPALGPGFQLAVDSKDRVYLLGAFSLIRVSPDGARETIVSPPSQPGVPPAGFGPTSMRSIGVDSARNVYFTGAYLGSPTDYVFRVNDDGTVTPVYGSASQPLIPANSASLALDSSGNVWRAGGSLSVINALGQGTLGRQDSGYSGDGGPAQSARFNATAIAFSPTGDLYMIDRDRIRKLTGVGKTDVPAIASGGIVNAVSYTGGAIAPGELISIFGSNFGAAGVQVNSPENNRIPWQLGRTKVLVDGIAGAIAAVTPTQINVFLPYYLEAGKSVNITVQVDEKISAPVRVPVATAAPGLSTADQSGSGPGAILNQDGRLNSAANPAARGSIVSFFGTGEGRVSPQLVWGELSISTPFSVPQEAVTVMIGGQPAEVTYAGAAPLAPVGVFQINARIPAAASAGAATVLVTIGGIATSKPVTVAVR